MITANAKALCGWKGREEINDAVYASMLAHKKIRSLTMTPIVSPHHSKKIESVKYWTGLASNNITKLKFIRDLYSRAYKKGDQLFKLIIDHAKINWERLDEINETRDYYYRQSMDAFQSGECQDYWNEKLHDLDSQIIKLENSK